MRSARFAIGLLAGVLLAVGVIIATSLSAAPPRMAPATQFVAATTTTATTVTETSSSTTTSGAIAGIITYSTSNSSSPSAFGFTSSGLSAPNSASAGLTSQPPSSLTRIVDQPIGSVVFLLPVVVALLLGLAFYRGSASRL